MTMHFAKLRLALAAFLTAGILGFGLPNRAWAQDEDDDGDNVLESDEVSGDDEEYEEEDEDGGSTTIVIKDTDPSAVVIFRDKLSPYGSWMEHPTYGTVWVPSSALVGSDFAPYVSSGRWELTEEGDWLWVSEYEWGYIPFHYGRWVWVSGVGWGWIPGRVYAPAWVVWRTGESGYIGWAPMPPAYYWADGFAVSLWLVPPAPYVFCHGHHVFHHHVHTHVIHDHDEVRRAAHATTAYTPAKPTKKHQPAQPTLKEAGIDGKYASKSVGKHDPKATRFMRPDGKGDKAAAFGKGSSPRSSGGVKGGGGSKGASGTSGRARTEGTRGSRSSDGVVNKRGSGRGSFTADEPAPRNGGRHQQSGRAKSVGKSSGTSSDASAPSNSDAPTTKSGKPSKAGKAGKSSRSSGSDDSSSSSRSSSPPSRSESPSVGSSSRSSAPPMSRSSSAAPSTKRAAPKPAAPRSSPRGPSRGSRGRR